MQVLLFIVRDTLLSVIFFSAVCVDIGETNPIKTSGLQLRKGPHKTNDKEKTQVITPVLHYS